MVPNQAVFVNVQETAMLKRNSREGLVENGRKSLRFHVPISERANSKNVQSHSFD
jgi:hypothetical protein